MPACANHAAPRPFALRPLCALLSLQLLLSACSATAMPYPGDEAGWAPPKPPAAPPTPLPAPWTRPNFEAPSAAHCARPLQTRELPGTPAETAQKHPWPAPARRLAPDAEALASGVAKGAVADGAAAPLAKSDHAPERRRAEPAAAPAPLSSPQPQPPAQRQGPETVTAGMVDDNADFGAYLAFRQRTPVTHRARDIRERHLLQVRDATGRGVPDAEVRVQSDQGAAMWARTDAAGQAWLHPHAFDAARASSYRVTVRQGGRQASTVLQRGQKSAVEVVLPGATPPARARLDLVFLVDATGSMGDEIDKLKASLQTIVAEVAALPSQPDLCLGLVAYRDKGDAFLLRSHDLTNDLPGFQGALNALQAAGGGDYPEAMNEAFDDTVHRLHWRGDGTTRLVVLLADAPPHLDDGGPQYDQGMLAALGKGIKVFSVGASGLDKQGEVIQRQIAQYTGGRFVFLTYDQARNPASGPGRETVHDVRNYSVDTLDRLIVRLVGEELGKLPRGG